MIFMLEFVVFLFFYQLSYHRPPHIKNYNYLLFSWRTTYLSALHPSRLFWITIRILFFLLRETMMTFIKLFSRPPPLYYYLWAIIRVYLLLDTITEWHSQTMWGEDWWWWQLLHSSGPVTHLLLSTLMDHYKSLLLLVTIAICMTLTDHVRQRLLHDDVDDD